jgi:arylsulfatase A-like enzyme
MRFADNHDDSRLARMGALRLPVVLRRGTTVLVRLAYDRRWQDPVDMTVRLLSGERVLHATSQRLMASWAETRFRSPLGGEAILEIRHRTGADGENRLQSLLVLDMDGTATADDRARARTLAAWAVRAGRSEADMGLVRRRFQLQCDGHRRPVTLIVAGDTVSFAIPPLEMPASLRLWSRLLRGSRRGSDGLAIQLRTLEGTRVLASRSCRELPAKEWRQFDIGIPRLERGGTLRIGVRGGEAVVAMGSPLLLSTDRTTPRKNVVLIDLDTVRADRLGCYGYRERPTTQRLDSVLTERGFAVFRRAYSGGPWTVPATAKFFTSRYRNIVPYFELPRQYTTLAEFLSTQGYYCAAITGGGVLQLAGFDQGFHEYRWDPEEGRVVGKVEAVFPHAERWLRSIDVRPFFLFVHTYEAHAPYTRGILCRDLPHGSLGDLTKGEPLFTQVNPSKRTAARRDWPTAGEVVKPERALTPQESTYVQAAYDGGVRTASDAVAEMLGVLEERGLWQNTVVIILSDHGEEFWEHSAKFGEHCSMSVYGELINVPFMVYDPPGAGRGVKMIMTEVSTVDLLPTVADLLGIEMTLPCDGVSIAGSIRGREIERRVPIMALTYEPGHPEEERACVVAAGLKYVEPLRPEAAGRSPYPSGEQLYHLSDDPPEARNRVSNADTLTTSMAALLRRGLSLAHPEMVTVEEGPIDLISDDARSQLRALGYLEEPQ